MIQRTLSGPSHSGLWFPYDCYLAWSCRRARLLQVPTIEGGSLDERHCYIRLECLGLLFIIDFVKRRHGDKRSPVSA